MARKHKPEHQTRLIPDTRETFGDIFVDTFRRILRSEMAFRNRSYRDLSLALPGSPQAWHNRISGRSPLTLAQAVDLARYLSLSVRAPFDRTFQYLDAQIESSSLDNHEPPV